MESRDDTVTAHLLESARIKQTLARTAAGSIGRMADLVLRSLEEGGKVMFCGNGGSAADSQHLAAELVVRYRRNRKALPAVALTTDTSVLTALGNDMGHDRVFSRQVEALGRPGDCLVAFSTSGTSKNVVQAVQTAKALGLRVVVLLGAADSPMEAEADLAIHVPSDDTARVQESHITIGHILCDLVEKRFVGNP